jgi:hypothetical protein
MPGTEDADMATERPLAELITELYWIGVARENRLHRDRLKREGWTDGEEGQVQGAEQQTSLHRAEAQTAGRVPSTEGDGVDEEAGKLTIGYQGDSLQHPPTIPEEG